MESNDINTTTTTNSAEVNTRSHPRTTYYPTEESIELTRRDILFQPIVDSSVSSSLNAAKVVFDVEYNSSIPSTPNKILRQSAHQSQPSGADVDRDDEAANILVLLQNAGHKDDANDDDGDGSGRNKRVASFSDQLGIISNSITTAIVDQSPPLDTWSTAISTEMARLWQELEMMRSEHDLAFVELKRLKAKFDAAVTTQRHNDLEQQNMEASTSRGDEMSTKEEVLILRIENEESKRKWSEASIRIAALSAKKIILVTRINDALDEARSTIASALNNDITNFNDINGMITDNSTNNSARTVSFEETGHHLPLIATTRQDERVLPSITTINDHIDSPQSRKRSNDTRPTTKSARFSSSLSCSSHGSGRVSFDCSTSFGNTNLPKFNIFNDSFSSRNNKKQKMKQKNTKLLPLGHKENGTTEDNGNGGDLPSNGLVYTQSSTRRKKYLASNAKGNSNSYSLDSFDDDKLY